MLKKLFSILLVALYVFGFAYAFVVIVFLCVPLLNLMFLPSTVSVNSSKNIWLELISWIILWGMAIVEWSVLCLFVFVIGRIIPAVALVKRYLIYFWGIGALALIILAIFTLIYAHI